MSPAIGHNRPPLRYENGVTLIYQEGAEVMIIIPKRPRLVVLKLTQDDLGLKLFPGDSFENEKVVALRIDLQKINHLKSAFGRDGAERGHSYAARLSVR